MSSDFKIFINSQKGTIVVPSNPNYTLVNQTYKNSFLNYTYDFNSKEDGLYEVTFTFVSNGGNYINGVKPAFLNIDFGLSNNFTTNPDSTSQCLGILYPKLDYVMQP